jgi:phage gp29-like protein
MKKTKKQNPKSQKNQTAVAIPPGIHTATGSARQIRTLADEQAPILTDYIRQYVGTAMPTPTPLSAVYLNKDRIWATQVYMELYGYDLYDEVEHDPHVSAIMGQRKLACAGLEYQIVPASNDPRDLGIAELVQRALDGVSGISTDFYELLDSVGKGFSVSEVLWGIDPDGYIVPVEIVNRPQRRFQFDAETREPKLRKLENPFFGDPLPARKFIVHRNGSKYNNPFGDALDQNIYWMWLFKRNVMKFWVQHTQTSAAPIPIMEIPQNADADLKAEAMNLVSQIRSGAYGTIPENFKMLWAEAKNAATAGETFESFIRFANDEMTKCVLGQLLTTEAGSSNGHGSHALGAIHQTVRTDILEYDAKALADTLSATLVRWIVELNFGAVVRYPSFQFLIDEPEDVVSRSQAILNLKNAGYAVTKEYIESELGVELEGESSAV